MVAITVVTLKTFATAAQSRQMKCPVFETSADVVNDLNKAFFFYVSTDFRCFYIFNKITLKKHTRNNFFYINISTMFNIEMSQPAPLHSDFVVYLEQSHNL